MKKFLAGIMITAVMACNAAPSPMPIIVAGNAAALNASRIATQNAQQISLQQFQQKTSNTCFYQIPGYHSYINLYNVTKISVYSNDIYLYYPGNSTSITVPKKNNNGPAEYEIEKYIKMIFDRLEQCKRGE